jgi:hypothetical protein
VIPPICSRESAELLAEEAIEEGYAGGVCAMSTLVTYVCDASATVTVTHLEVASVVEIVEYGVGMGSARRVAVVDACIPAVSSRPTRGVEKSFVQHAATNGNQCTEVTSGVRD